MRHWLCILLFFTSVSAHGHWSNPGYLELKQTSAESYSVLWKVPLQSGVPLTMAPVLPAACANQTPVNSVRAATAVIERWIVRCNGGLAGKAVSIRGLSTTVNDVLARVTRLDGTVQTVRLKGDAASFDVAVAPDWIEVAMTYLILGIEHILLGADHLLFVLALLIIVSGWRRLIATVTAFTLAHSITLGAATLGLVHMPRPPVEAAIAISILFLAMEIAHRYLFASPAAAGTADAAPTPAGPGTPPPSSFKRDGDSGFPADRSLTYDWPWLVAFAFGLLHGFGFSGALSEIGLPQNDIPLALLFFNVGVEIGQLLFVAGFLLLSRATAGIAARYASRVEIVTAYAIGALAAYWTIERVVGFWI